MASAILYGCYRAVEWRWPERYIGMHETFGLSSTETWLRFLAYRGLPFFLIAATTCVTVERVGGIPTISAWVIWILSVLLTHGRVIVESFRSRHGEVNYAGYHAQMILLLTLVLIGAVTSIGWWSKLVPPPEEFLAAIWSGLLVAGLGGFVIVTLRPRSERSPWYGAPYFIDRATRDVGVDVLDFLFQECIRTGADPILIKSILVVEVVQRPRWFRRIERLGVRLGIAKTSGAMQMESDRPLSDRASITFAAEKYAGIWSLRRMDASAFHYWEPDLGSAWPVVARHNGDISFIKAVSQVSYSLASLATDRYRAGAEHAGLILELRRYAEGFALRGVSRSRTLVIVEYRGGEILSTQARRIRDDSAGSWSAWEASISPESDQIVLVEPETEGVSRIKIVGGEIERIVSDRLELVADGLGASESGPRLGGRSNAEELRRLAKIRAKRVLASRGPGLLRWARK